MYINISTFKLLYIGVYKFKLNVTYESTNFLFQMSYLSVLV